MSEIDYVAWWKQASERRQGILGELEDIDSLLAHLYPLAVRAGLQDGDNPAPPRPELTAESVRVEPGDGGTSAEREDAEAPELRYKDVPSTDAALDYLRREGRPRSTRQIADALLAGGLTTTAPETFTTNIYTSLRRVMKRGDIKRVGAGKWQASETAGE